MSALVLLAIVGAPHGVRGEVRLKTFTADPLAVKDYGPLTTPDGRSFEITSVRPAQDVVIARLKGITDRTQVERLKGLSLSVSRETFPIVADDEFYHADLIGLPVVTDDGRTIGELVAIHDFGAGDILDIRRPGQPNLTLGFTRANVPEIDIAGRRITVVLPNEVEVRGEE